MFRGEQDFPGLINAFVPSFTKERIVKVSYFLDICFGDVYVTWRNSCKLYLNGLYSGFPQLSGRPMIARLTHDSLLKADVARLINAQT